MRSTLLSTVLALLLLCWPAAPARASLLHLAGPPPIDLGVHEGHLAPCPGPAHCAQAEWPVADPAAALATLLPAVLSQPGVKVVATSADYLHATFTSRVFGFVDDLELHADGAGGRIQARSISRVGDSDLGVNAHRLEMVRSFLKDS